MTAPVHPKLDFPHRHLLGIEGLSPFDMQMDMADEAVELNRQVRKQRDTLRGRTLIKTCFSKVMPLLHRSGARWTGFG